MDGERISVERLIDAPPGRIFELLADAGKHAVFDGSGTVQHTTAPSVPLSLGSVFAMRMRGTRETLFLPYTMRNTVIEFEENRRIAWQPTTFGGLIGGRIWRYELSATNSQTLVREEWDISHDKQKRFLRRSDLPKQVEKAMRATLDRIADVLSR